MKGLNESRPKETKQKHPNYENNNKGAKNIFNRKQIRPRSISLSPDNFDSFGSQRQRDERNAHAKQEAYGKMLLIDSYRKNINNDCVFQDLYDGFIRITKGHLQWNLFDPKKAITATGKIILSNGNFFIVLIQILKKCPYLTIAYIARTFKQTYGQKITSNKEDFYKLVQQLEDQQKKKQEQKKRFQLSMMPQQIAPIKISQIIQNDNPQYSGRKSILKKSGIKTKSVSFNPQLQYPELQSLNIFAQQVQKQEKQKLEKKQKQQKQKLEKKQKQQKIKKDHGVLLDTLEINDIYDQENYQVVGVLNQFENSYAILLIKQKTRTEPPSYVKTRKTYSQREQFEKQFEQIKKKQEILCIAVMKDMQNKSHNQPLLKKIQSEYHNLAFFNVKKYSQRFMNDLPSESVVKSGKKQNNLKIEVQAVQDKTENVLKHYQSETGIQKQEISVMPSQNKKTQDNQCLSSQSINNVVNQAKGLSIITSTVGPNVNIRVTRHRQNQNPNTKSSSNNNNEFSNKNTAAVSNQKTSNSTNQERLNILSRLKNHVFGPVPKAGSKSLSNGK